MTSSFRPITIVVEVIVLMGVIYSLLLGVKLTALDFGLEEKYQKFIDRVWVIVGGMALVFFVAHLVAFYPRLAH